jgi:hypothetical protein
MTQNKLELDTQCTPPVSILLQSQENVENSNILEIPEMESDLEFAVVKEEKIEQPVKVALKRKCEEMLSSQTKLKTMKNNPVFKSKGMESVRNEESRRRSPRISSRESSVESSVEMEKPSTSFPPQRSDRNSRNSLRSSQESTSERTKSPAISNKEFHLQNCKKKKILVDEVRRKSLRSSRESSLEIATQGTKVRQFSESESDSGPVHSRNTKKRSRILQSTDESGAEQRNIDEESGTTLIGPTPRGRGRPRKNEVTKNTKKKTAKSKISDGDSDSRSTNDNHEPSRNYELKSRLSPMDFNSTYKSSILVRNDYLKSTDKQTTAESSTAIDQLATKISSRKENDSYYATPPLITKRDRLRTSAFKGNQNDFSTDEDISREPSVSRGSNEKRVANKLKSRKQIASTQSLPVSLPSTAKGSRRGRKPKLLDELVDIKKKEFVQGPLENPIEKCVPYNEILHAIKISLHPKKTGREKKAHNGYDSKRETDLKTLQKLKFFRCGSCQFEVTKHKWIEHFEEHGGIAWIDGFENPILLDDWNEALRRTINIMKIYNISIFYCSNCRQEKRSALGHLSHVFLCGESEETIERRKINCELCNERILPFNASFHKNKCFGNQKANEENGKDEVNEETITENDETEELHADSFNSSGRLKRKAVKK